MDKISKVTHLNNDVLLDIIDRYNRNDKKSLSISEFINDALGFIELSREVIYTESTVNSDMLFRNFNRDMDALKSSNISEIDYFPKTISEVIIVDSLIFSFNWFLEELVKDIKNNTININISTREIKCVK